MKKYFEKNLQRSEIIHTNFFKYLDKSKVSFRKYADDNHIDRTMASKWKNGQSNMTVDQIYQAAKYFDITVNDLYYTEKEKAEISVLSDSSYDPIMAQKTLDVKIFDRLFKNSGLVLIFALAMFLFLGYIAFILIKTSSVYWIFGISISLFLMKPIIVKIFTYERTYIINYLDDIFYEREDKIFELSKLQAVIAVLSVIGFVPIMVMISKKKIDSNTDLGVLISFVYMFSFLFFVTKILHLFFIKPKPKQMIYDTEIQEYNISFINLLLTLGMMTSMVIILIDNFKSFWLIGLTIFIIFIFQAIDFTITSKKYLEYKITYEEYGKKGKMLFPNKDE